MGFDFGSAITFGSCWEYVKYGIAQALTKSVDAASRTNAAVAVAVPSAVLHIARGHFLDVGGDLVGHQKSERTPNWLARKSPKFKKNLFWALTAASAALTAGVYVVNDAPFFPSQESAIVETVEENRERLEGDRGYTYGQINLEKKLNEEISDEEGSRKGLEYSL